MADYAILLHAALETAKISLPTVIEAQRGTLSQAECDKRLRRWAARLLQRVGADLKVSGSEHVERGPGPFVVVSNHQSLYDIPALYVGLPLSLRMAAKTELFRIPLWGSALRASGFVEINRSSPTEARRALQLAGERLRRDSTSLFIAPEGTRSSDGQVGPFKKGAFHIAQSMNLLVLPVAISGTLDIHKKGAKRVTKGARIRLRILEPFSASELGPDQSAEKARSDICRSLLETIPGSDPSGPVSRH